MNPSPKSSWPRKCKTKFCRNFVTKRNHNLLCPKCANRRFKEKHPLKYSFNCLKYRARQRGHAFTLTYEQYENFALKSGYAFGKGKTANCLTIDRIDPRRGYEIDNIQVLTVSENSRKWKRIQYANIPAWLREEIRQAENPTAAAA